METTPKPTRSRKKAETTVTEQVESPTPDAVEQVVDDNVQQAVMTTSVQQRIAGETVTNDSSEQRVNIGGLPEHPARVRLSLGGTYKTGDYENVKIEVEVSMPCAPTRKGIQKTYDRLNMIVAGYLHDQLQQLGMDMSETGSETSFTDDQGEGFQRLGNR